VAFIIAATVVPAGVCSIAITRDCFERGSVCLDLALPTVRFDGLAGGVDGLDIAGDRFLTDFAIRSSVRLMAALRRTLQGAVAVTISGRTTGAATGLYPSDRFQGHRTIQLSLRQLRLHTGGPITQACYPVAGSSGVPIQKGQYL
jgi:hypothetical protein